MLQPATRFAARYQLMDKQVIDGEGPTLNIKNLAECSIAMGVLENEGDRFKCLLVNPDKEGKGDIYLATRKEGQRARKAASKSWSFSFFKMTSDLTVLAQNLLDLSSHFSNETPTTITPKEKKLLAANQAGWESFKKEPSPLVKVAVSHGTWKLMD